MGIIIILNNKNSWVRAGLGKPNTCKAHIKFKGPLSNPINIPLSLIGPISGPLNTPRHEVQPPSV